MSQNINLCKVVVIGCGYWGKNLIRNFYELNALYGVSDSDMNIANSFAKEYQVKALALDEALQNSEIKGVVIAAPAILHAKLAEQALNAGKHVFIEKPLALNLDEANMLCNIAKHKNLVIMVGHLLQYHNAFIALTKLVQNGVLGKLQHIYSNRLSFGKIRHEENVVLSFAPHDISMVLKLVGELPESIYANGAGYINSDIEDTATICLTFKNQVNAKISVSWLNPTKEHKLVVIGDKGMAVFDDTLSWEKKLQLYPHRIKRENQITVTERAEPLYIKVEEKQPLKTECAHFLECINDNKRPITDGEEGLRVLEVLQAAQQSLKGNKIIKIEKDIAGYYKHESAIVDDGCFIEEGTKIWHFSHIIKGSKIGKNCVIGQNVMVGPDVIIGNNCKIQNNVSVYKGVYLEDGVFCGPSCVFTNVYNPRSEIERKDEYRPTYVEKGVTIGANATIICGTRLGAYSFIGAGAVIIKDVKPHALMVGNPARQIGWMSHAGEKLGDDLICPRTGDKYRLNDRNTLQKI
ncbi:NAD-dependent oxidoreductase [endosymbiont of Acanthamoeba sp. UWC8]|uniref:Gfo/Idh/MocA family oxidoreductase n=1 Tax=endosymbiont of Acanthamoeba sp. UWC8 TaxID=86106 RepID=UPI0004D1BFAF|nr:Gfo/Idh/MocA family oxidoreductase [endosymbiont of Acanthamoeba sp. UWC8]AIF82009.1 NAD-dependent oxidoreductase [endosymbiont of Acanthamoeba sp. UWC8]